MLPMAEAVPERRLFEDAREVLLAELPEVEAIYAYGSLARGDAGPDSDLDLAVLLPPGGRIADPLDLMAKVSRRVHRDVDLVDLREAGLDLVWELLREGRLLYSRDPERTLAWEAERMTDYADFQPRRAALLDLYLREPLRSPP